MQSKIKPNLTLVIITSLVFLPTPALVQAEIQRTPYEANGNYLIVEVLKDDLIHFEYGAGSAPASNIQLTTISPFDLIQPKKGLAFTR